MKGVSQVLSSTIILAVAVSVAGVYSNWAPEFAGSITGETADQANRDIRCGNAALTIETAEYDLSGNFTEVELRNSGTIDLNNGTNLVAYGENGILARTVMGSVEAGDTLQERLDSDQAPERIAASSRDCPGDVVVSTDTVRVTE